VLAVVSSWQEIADLLLPVLTGSDSDAGDGLLSTGGVR
jgi:hypothetical protein